MDIRFVFDKNPENYDKWRPIYLPEVFKDIISYAGITDKKQVIEIGIGTGQATEPFLKTGCKIIAIELGKNLSEFSKEKFKGYNNFKIENISFEDYEGEINSTDLIYSASAFHWIAKETGYKKAFSLLKSGGTLALFRNTPSAGSACDTLHQDIQKIYQKYMPDSKHPGNKKINYDNIGDEIQKYGFENLIVKQYYNTRNFNSENYIRLLNTYSDHIILPSDIKTRFETEIKKSIENNGDFICIHDTIDLYLSQKP